MLADKDIDITIASRREFNGDSHLNIGSGPDCRLWKSHSAQGSASSVIIPIKQAKVRQLSSGSVLEEPVEALDILDMKDQW
ncbi:MAG TPA: hypothetical protein VLD67_21515 [Vicinamibacterales bacterium]|nr:hypothetical protein [Vicinamibacterales bacterium]